MTGNTNVNWDDKYGGKGYLFGTKPNTFLASQAHRLKPGERSLDVGGGNPVAFGISLGRKVLVAFYHEGELYEWNFTKELQRQRAEVTETATHLRWEIEAADLTGLALDLAEWGSDDLPFLTEPPEAALDQARRLLTELGALDGGPRHQG